MGAGVVGDIVVVPGELDDVPPPPPQDENNKHAANTLKGRSFK
jgi:hypothetical protein